MDVWLIDLIGFYGEGGSAVSLECSIRCPARRRVEVAVETSTRQGHPIPRHSLFLVGSPVLGDVAGGCLLPAVLVAGRGLLLAGRRMMQKRWEMKGNGKTRRKKRPKRTASDVLMRSSSSKPHQLWKISDCCSVRR